MDNKRANFLWPPHGIAPAAVKKILKSSFKSRNYIQDYKHGPYFEVSAIQASSVTLTLSGDEIQR